LILALVLVLVVTIFAVSEYKEREANSRERQRQAEARRKAELEKKRTADAIAWARETLEDWRQPFDHVTLKDGHDYIEYIRQTDSPLFLGGEAGVFGYVLQESFTFLRACSKRVFHAQLRRRVIRLIMAM
jgi:hypothetical protein